MYHYTKIHVYLPLDVLHKWKTVNIPSIVDLHASNKPFPIDYEA